jgi:hypothetical protein
MSTQTTTDLAARFEAKREECVKLAQEAFNQGGPVERHLRGQSSAFAEARDMARADAAGGAGEGFVLLPREPTEGMERAFDTAYWAKAGDASSPTPTEHPEDGGGPFGYGYRAMLKAVPPARDDKTESDLDWLRKQIVELCERTEDEMYEALQKDPTNQHEIGFYKGREWEAKGIRRAISEVVRLRKSEPPALVTLSATDQAGEVRDV